MKKFTLFAVLMLIISIGLLNAQTNQGKVLLGASSDLMNIGVLSIRIKSDADGYKESDPDKAIYVNLLPKVGYFVVDNLALGFGLNVAHLTNKSPKASNTLLSVEPFIRCYIPTSKVLPFIEISGSYGTIKSKYDFNSLEDPNYINTEHKSSVKSMGGGIGLAAPLGEKVTFDVLVGYNLSTFKNKENIDNNHRTVIGALGLKLGFAILLGSN